MTDPTPLTPAPPNAPAPATPQARAQAMTETLVNTGTVPDRFKDEQGNVNQTYLFQTMLEMEKGETPAQVPVAPAAPSAAATAPVLKDSAAPATPASASGSLADALSGPALPEGTNPWDQATKDLETTGAITESTVAALKAINTPDSAIASIARDFAAKAQSDMDSAYGVCGDKAGFDATIAWAKESLNPEELRQFDVGLKTPHALMILAGIHARAAAAAPLPSGQVDTGTGENAIIGNTGALTPFATREDCLRFMQDPKYRTDPDFRKEVEIRQMMMSGVSYQSLRDAGLT